MEATRNMDHWSEAIDTTAVSRAIVSPVRDTSMAQVAVALLVAPFTLVCAPFLRATEEH